MKKIIALIMAAVMLLSLTACGKDKTPTQTDQDIVALENEQFAETFQKAELLYSWFTGCNHMEMDDLDFRMVDDAGYFRVIEEGYDTLSGLTAALNSCFSQEITQELITTPVYGDVPLYREIEGKLYGFGGYGGLVRWDIGKRHGEVTERTDNTLTYHLTISYDEYGAEIVCEYDYHCVLGEDGQWRFTNFALPAQLVGEKLFGSEAGE